MRSLRQILAEKMENKNHEGLLKHPVYIAMLSRFLDVFHFHRLREKTRILP